MGANYRRLFRSKSWRCGGVITDKTTDAELRARGYSDADIAEVRAFIDRLKAKGARAVALSARDESTPSTGSEE